MNDRTAAGRLINAYGVLRRGECSVEEPEAREHQRPSWSETPNRRIPAGCSHSTATAQTRGRTTHPRQGNRLFATQSRPSIMRRVVWPRRWLKAEAKSWRRARTASHGGQERKLAPIGSGSRKTPSKVFNNRNGRNRPAHAMPAGASGGADRPLMPSRGRPMIALCSSTCRAGPSGARTPPT